MGKTVPQAPKSPQIFTQKRVAPFLFYKFYKFRGKYLFVFNALQGYRQQMGTEKGEMGTERQQMGAYMLIDRQHLIAELCCHGKNYPDRG